MSSDEQVLHDIQGGNNVDWTCCAEVVRCGGPTRVMGILNVTPDSFSDGGRFVELERAVERGVQMAEQGACIIDVGGESTRPGARLVEASEEIARVVPVISALRAQSDVLISIDTQKAVVAQEALDAGAQIINDVSALGDPEMAAVVARSGAGLILMHMQGTPQTMQDDPRYDDIVREVAEFLQQRMRRAMESGVLAEQIVLDPGIGFGKTEGHNALLLKGLPVLARMGRPVLVGASRKRFIGEWLGRGPGERMAGSLGAAVFAVLNGAHIVRVHDVIETCDALGVVDRLKGL